MPLHGRQEYHGVMVGGNSPEGNTSHIATGITQTRVAVCMNRACAYHGEGNKCAMEES